MRRDIITSVIGIFVFTILLGLVYPLVITGVSQVAFPGNANGQQIHLNGKLIGSKIIGQSFASHPRYFQSRPSATEGGAYNAAASTFSNRGPNSVKTEEANAENIKAYLELNKPYDPGLTVAQIPVDAVNTSGLNPSPRNLTGQRLDSGASHRGQAWALTGEGERPNRSVHIRARSGLLGRTRRECA